MRGRRRSRKATAHRQSEFRGCGPPYVGDGNHQPLTPSSMAYGPPLVRHWFMSPTAYQLTEMRPVAADPRLTLTQLLEELAKIEDERHRADVRDQIIVRLNRKLKRMSDEARAKAQLAAGETPEDTLARFRAGEPG